MYFIPMTTLGQCLLHPKDRIPKHLKQSDIVYAVKCSEESKPLLLTHDL